MCVPVKGKLEVERRRKFEDATTKTSSPRFGPFYRLHQRVCLSDGQSIKFDRREFRRREISISLRGGKPPPPDIPAGPIARRALFWDWDRFYDRSIPDVRN